MGIKRMVVFYSPDDIKRLDQATDRLLAIRDEFMAAHHETLAAVSNLRANVQTFMYAAEETEREERPKKPTVNRRRAKSRR